MSSYPWTELQPSTTQGFFQEETEKQCNLSTVALLQQHNAMFLALDCQSLLLLKASEAVFGMLEVLCKTSVLGMKAEMRL